MRLGDVRRIFRLIGEIREIGSAPDQWRPHALRGLCKIVPADLIVSSEVHFRTTVSPGVLWCIDIGWFYDGSATPPWKVESQQEENPQTYQLALGGAAPQPAPHTAAHPNDDLDTSAIVPVSPTLRLRGGKNFLFSQYPLAHLGAVDQLGLHRFSIADPFTPNDHKLARLFHVELGRLWRSEALRRAADPRAKLPPRLAQTLDQLLKGDSEKQIAYDLGLSQHTIHNYIKALHQRFDVSSRAELLAKAMSEQSAFVPKLSVSIKRRAGRKPRPEGVLPELSASNEEETLPP